jgi:hypothetical protein
MEENIRRGEEKHMGRLFLGYERKTFIRVY